LLLFGINFAGIGVKVHFLLKLFTVEDRKDKIRPNQKPLVLI